LEEQQSLGLDPHKETGTAAVAVLEISKRVTWAEDGACGAGDAGFGI